MLQFHHWLKKTDWLHFWQFNLEFTSLSLLFRMPRTKSVRFLSNIRSKFPLTFFKAIFSSHTDFGVCIIIGMPNKKKTISLILLSCCFYFPTLFHPFIHTEYRRFSLFLQSIHTDSIIRCTMNYDFILKTEWNAKNKRKSVENIKQKKIWVFRCPLVYVRSQTASDSHTQQHQSQWKRASSMSHTQSQYKISK